MSIIWTIVILGLLIFVHECGHFLMARLCGVKVKVFSLGFGPKLIGKKWGETEYIVSAFPLGGYVSMLGESPTETVAESERHRSFFHQPIWKRSLIVVAGPLFNILAAMVIFIGIFVLAGKPIMLPKVGNVEPKSPAAQAGLKKGDCILAVNGHQVKSWQQLALLIKTEGQHGPLKLLIKRDNQELVLVVRPQIKKLKTLVGDTVERPVIGIMASGEVEIQRLGLFKAVNEGIKQTWVTTKLTLITLKNLLLGRISLKMLAGPIGIVQLTSQEAKAGLAALFSFAALISINLGVINLFPLPALDGGHLFLYGIEAIRRRPFDVKTLEFIQKTGFVILGLLMLLVMYNDILRIFPNLAKKIIP